MIPWLHSEFDPLPDPRLALPPGSDAPGLLAAGGDLTPERLTEAYSKGIFPWYSEGQPVLWWSPDPRMVLVVGEFKLSRSLRKTVARFARTPDFDVRIDTAFDRVITACAGTPREGQDGTWIVPAMVTAYRHWHRLGTVHSFETWVDGELAGGVQEGLVLVRSVNIHQRFAERSEGIQRCRRAIDELAVGACGRKSAFEHELVVFARFETIFREKRFQRSFEPADVENRFDRATVAAGADVRAVGALAEHEVQRSDENGFAGAGFAGDNVIARLQFEGEVGDESEIFNAQRGQHANSFVLNLAIMLSLAKEFLQRF